MSNDYFEIYSSVEGTPSGTQKLQWRWRLCAGNNRTIASGQGYDQEESCRHAIDLLKGTTKDTPVKDVAG